LVAHTVCAAGYVAANNCQSAVDERPRDCARLTICCPGAMRAPGTVFLKQLTPYCVSVFGGAGVFDGAGVNGRGADEPDPVVLGGVAGFIGVLAVDVVEEPLLAVLLLLFQPAMIRNPISRTTATPAIQPHIPPTASSRRITGSFNRGSVKRGSVMGILLRSVRFAAFRMRETR
jgi:hypothetical protein